MGELSKPAPDPDSGQEKPAVDPGHVNDRDAARLPLPTSKLPRKAKRLGLTFPPSVSVQTRVLKSQPSNLHLHQAPQSSIFTSVPPSHRHSQNRRPPGPKPGNVELHSPQGSASHTQAGRSDGAWNPSARKAEASMLPRVRGQPSCSVGRTRPGLSSR